jgi:hypothetical protein
MSTNEIIEKIKSKASEHLIAVVFAIPLLLSGVIWSVIPSGDVERLLDTPPKKLLWAIIGITIWLILLLLAFNHNLRKERKALQQRLDAKPLYKFGICWDKEDHKPLCPTCLNAASSYVRAASSGIDQPRKIRPHQLHRNPFKRIDEPPREEPKKQSHYQLWCSHCKKPLFILDDGQNELTLAGAQTQLKDAT